jgi:hypothetical protein
MSHSSISLWKQVVANDGLPPCTEDLNEPQLAELMFGRSCDVSFFLGIPQRLNHFLAFCSSGAGEMSLARKPFGPPGPERANVVLNLRDYSVAILQY